MLHNMQQSKGCIRSISVGRDVVVIPSPCISSNMFTFARRFVKFPLFSYRYRASLPSFRGKALLARRLLSATAASLALPSAQGPVTPPTSNYLLQAYKDVLQLMLDPQNAYYIERDQRLLKRFKGVETRRAAILRVFHNDWNRGDRAIILYVSDVKDEEELCSIGSKFGSYVNSNIRLKKPRGASFDVWVLANCDGTANTEGMAMRILTKAWIE